MAKNFTSAVVNLDHGTHEALSPGEENLLPDSDLDGVTPSQTPRNFREFVDLPG